MESIFQILPLIVVILVIFLIREGLSIYGYVKYCKLHEAAKQGNVDKILKLLEEGHLVNGLDRRFGLSPLHYAVRNGHLEAAKVLIKNGAGLTDPSLQGITPLEWSSEYLTPDQQNELARLAADEDAKNQNPES